MIVLPKNKKVGRPTNVEVNLSGCSLTMSEQRVFVDEKLKWAIHIKHICCGVGSSFKQEGGVEICVCYRNIRRAYHALYLSKKDLNTVRRTQAFL